MYVETQVFHYEVLKVPSIVTIIVDNTSATFFRTSGC